MIGLVGSVAVSSASGIWPEITDIDECSWPATTDSRPMNSGSCLNAFRYSTTGYWNSWIDCQRHMFWLGAVPLARPLGATGGVVFCQEVVGCWPVNGYTGVSSVASSVSVQLRLPLPPWPACTNQSSPHGVSTLSVAFFTSFC